MLLPRDYNCMAEIIKTTKDRNNRDLGRDILRNCSIFLYSDENYTIIQNAQPMSILIFLISSTKPHLTNSSSWNSTMVVFINKKICMLKEWKHLPLQLHFETGKMYLLWLNITSIFLAVEFLKKYPT